MKVSILVAAFSVVVLNAVEAKCSPPAGYPFFVDQNDTVTYAQIADAKGCGHNFRSGGQTIFPGASILLPAKNGKFVQIGALNFSYTPKAGFKGLDTYAVKVCGTNRGGSGCSTINYRTTIE
jgi:hypothetical protein